MHHSLKIALAQLNFTVGDLSGNLQKIINYYLQAVQDKADLVVFSELAITGYPPEDLLLNNSFLEQAELAIHQLAAKTANYETAIIIGGVATKQQKLYNMVFTLYRGKIISETQKQALPNYGVFDELRYFTSGEASRILEFKGHKLGIVICEDMWNNYIIDQLAKQRAELIITINASPFEINKNFSRIKLAKSHCIRHNIPLIYLNQIGGQDSLLFDGRSFYCNKEGEIKGKLAFCEEEMSITTWHKIENKFEPEPHNATLEYNREETIYLGLVVALRDYVNKNNFTKVILGLSGGIDSAFTATLAVDSLGAENVECLILPSQYTSKESLKDAEDCSNLLGIKLISIPITDLVEQSNQLLQPFFMDLPTGLTEENIQPRLRALILMAFSNKFGHLLLTTGNKSEMAVGYATLYGDMCGGFNPIKDLYKTEVYTLSNWRNNNFIKGLLGKNSKCIPGNILTKPPTAELKDNQFDQDTLPPYDLLDKILHMLIEGGLSQHEIIEKGYDRCIVEKVSKLLYIAEYKRRQSSPGPKISSMSFDLDRRYPITNKWRN